MYNYQDLKPKVFTEKGQEQFLRIRDRGFKPFFVDSQLPLAQTTMLTLNPTIVPQIENTIVLSPEYYVDRTFCNFSSFMPQGYTYSGEKFTIIGDNVDSAIWLLEKVGLFMLRIGVGFKVATRRQIETQNAEQRLKLLTVYLSPTVDKTLLLDDLNYLLREYNGHKGLSLQYSTHLGGAIYQRNDTTPDGDYTPAQKYC